MAHVVGESRYQGLLFSEPLDALVGSDDPVRVVDAFVDSLDLSKLGFSRVETEETGRPPYAPGDLLKLYVYGYLNRVRSSRRLEREAQRNVEVMWLINRLAPSFKTIADFRKDHPEAIVGVCRAFVRFCREQALYGGKVVAIDGSKIEAVASRKKVMTPKRIAERTAEIDRKIAEYLASLDEADRRERTELLGPRDVPGALAALPGQREWLQQEAQAPAALEASLPVEIGSEAPVAGEDDTTSQREAPAAEADRQEGMTAEATSEEAPEPAAAAILPVGAEAELEASTTEAGRQEQEAVEAADRKAARALRDLQEEREQLQWLARRMAAQGLSQLVLLEEEARLMRTARHGHQVAYNAQTVVDSQHKLIAAFDLTNDGNDHCQLHPMAVQGQQALESTALTVVADAGYSNGKHGELCEAAGIVAVVPRAETVNGANKDHFSRDRFTYDAASDSWQCPAGEKLTCEAVSYTEEKKRYSTPACSSCAMKGQCTDAAKRTITRSFYEDAREAMHRWAQNDPTWMKLRRATVEHPFGTMKWLMGYPRFLVRGLRKAKAELALVVLSFNLKRVINILGVQRLLLALQPSPT